MGSNGGSEQRWEGSGAQVPESPRGPMEFLSRSWSASALKISKALSSSSSIITTTKTPPSPLVLLNNIPKSTTLSSNSIPEEEEEEEDIITGERNDTTTTNTTLSSLHTTFSFASSATSQLVLERILSHSEVSPLTSGRLSHSSGPLNVNSLTEDTDSPPVSPSQEFDDVVKYLRANNTLQPLFAGKHGAHGGGGGISTPGGKTVGRWLKERREKKKEETRAHNAHLHAAVSVAGVAAAVATIAAATAAGSAAGKDEQIASADMAVASAATLVAAQCVEAAEAMGAEREHLTAAISSAVNVRSHGDIMTLTAAAATALRGAATLKARALKEVWNIAAVIPVEKGMVTKLGPKASDKDRADCNSYSEELVPQENFLGVCNQEFLAKGSELLKRTRKGDLHWKIVSVYIHRTGQVMLKMKSRHIAGTITKKKKNVVLEVRKDVQAWPGRHLFEDGEQRRYFGLKTATRGIVEFECKNQREFDIWTHGVSRLLSIVAERKNRIHK